MNQLTNIGAYAGASSGAADVHLRAISKAIVGPWAAVNAVWEGMVLSWWRMVSTAVSVICNYRWLTQISQIT